MPGIEQIKVRKKSRLLRISFNDGTSAELEFEFLRVHSPSAEVRGHAKGQEQLQTGKQDVDLLDVQPVGNYAVKLVFDDGHDTGIYTWDYLYELGRNKDSYWRDYLIKVKQRNERNQ